MLLGLTLRSRGRCCVPSGWRRAGFFPAAASLAKFPEGLSVLKLLCFEMLCQEHGRLEQTAIRCLQLSQRRMIRLLQHGEKALCFLPFTRLEAAPEP